MAPAKQAPAVERVGFKLDDFTAGGVVPEGDYLHKEFQVVFWDYDGKLPTGTLALRITMQPLVGGKPEGDELSQHYSIGDPESFGPSEDGYSIMAIGERTSLGKGSNFFVWLENLVNAGFPEDKFENDFEIFKGLIGHVVHIPAPTRNLPKGGVTGTGGSERERTIPVVSKIVKLPWETAKKAARPKRQAVAEAPAAEEGDAGGLLMEHLGSILESGASVAKTRARVQVFKRMNDAKVETSARDAALRIFNSDESLAEVLGGLGYVVDGGNLVPSA